MDPSFNPAQAARAHRESLRQMAKAAGLPGLQDEPLRMQRLCDVAEAMDVNKVTPEIETFFESNVHDSMAGFMKQLDEYKRNGIGLMKFRTVFKGND